MSTFFENTQKLIHEAARVAGISGDALLRMQTPDKILEFEIPVGGKKFSGWRVQHNNVLGPYKGGIRFHPDSNLDEVKALASLMTWKTSLAGIPYGGGKGAVRVNPRELSEAELEELCRGFVRKIWKEIGPDKDVPAPDVNTNSQMMDWMTDEYSKLAGRWEPAVFTGKSVEKGGSRGREVATGFGGYVVLREYLKISSKFKIQSQKLTVAIQGFGNVGMYVAKYLFRDGYKIVAVSDSKGGMYEEGGIDIEKLSEVKARTGIIDRKTCFARLSHEGTCGTITNEELLELPVDILVPAALEGVITEVNAGRIKAKTILELANGPTTQEADVILEKNGIEVIPDILANAGGVVGSYFEWVQSKANEYWDEKKVLKSIDDKLVEAFAAVADVRGKYMVTWRMAAFVRAIARVAEGMAKS